MLRSLGLKFTYNGTNRGTRVSAAPRPSRRRIAIVAIAGCLSLGTSVPAGIQAGAAGASANIVLQSMDSCQTALGGGLFALEGGTLSGPVFAGPAAQPSVTVASGGCPLQQGSCVTITVGCVTFPNVPVGVYTIKWSVSPPAGQTSPGGYAACTGGSACQSEVVNLTVQNDGTVTAQTTNVYPDGTTVTWPDPPHTNYGATAADPVVFHSFGLGTGDCDGDGDADDHLTGSPSSHCAYAPEGGEATACPGQPYPWDCSIVRPTPSSTFVASGSVVVGVRGADDGPLWVNPNSKGYVNYGGRLIAAPAIASLGNGNHLYIVTGVDQRLWQRTDLVGYQLAAPPGTYCIDNPAVYVSPGGSATIACAGSDHQLFVNHGTVDASGTFSYGAWVPLGGYLYSGPSIGLVQGQLHYFVEGANHDEYDRTDSTGYSWTAWGCIGHQGLADDLAGKAYFTCHGTDGQEWVAVNAGAGWSAAMPLGGRIVDGTSIAAWSGGATIAVVGVDASAWTITVDTAGHALTGWSWLGGRCFFGTGVAPL